MREAPLDGPALKLALIVKSLSLYALKWLVVVVVLVTAVQMLRAALTSEPQGRVSA